MYTRPFFKDDESQCVPENYGGTAMSDSGDCEDTRSAYSPIEESECGCGTRCEDTHADARKSILDALRDGGLKGLIPNIGTEEILIIAVALFLFISRDGDKECAIMLLLLLIL